MKLAVVGGGSTYTPELIDGFARLRDELPLSEVALVDPDAHRLSLVAGMSRRMLARAGHPAVVTEHAEGRAGGRGGRGGAAAAPRGRPGGPERGRDAAAGVRLRRPGDDRRGRPGQGAADGPGRAGDRRGGPPPRAGRVDRRLHQPRRDRDAGAAGRRPPARSGSATWRSGCSGGSPGCSACRGSRSGWATSA